VSTNEAVFWVEPDGSLVTASERSVNAEPIVGAEAVRIPRRGSGRELRMIHKLERRLKAEERTPVGATVEVEARVLWELYRLAKAAAWWRASAGSFVDTLDAEMLMHLACLEDAL
jgi:hypothetical protein